jgi:hypothetical protein
MKVFKKIVLFTLVMVWLVLEAGALVAQDRYSTLIGSVKGIHVHGLRKWLEVESEQEKAIVNFRIGKNTVYNPHRYPNVGEKVKVEYLTNRGVPVAYTVTILGGQKEEGAKENKK